MLQIDEMLDAAEKLKGIGNEQFKVQNYKVAEKKYTKTLRQDKTFKLLWVESKTKNGVAVTQAMALSWSNLLNHIF